MDFRTIGCVELNSVAWGMHIADEMVKSASVKIVLARPTCPGRYIVIISGDTSAVQSAVEVGRELGADMTVDSFTIPSVHPDVLPAMSGTTVAPKIDALGVIETYTTAACILAADAAAKSAEVQLIEVRMAAGLAGKSYVTMTGDVGSVRAAVESGVAGVGEAGPVHSHVVIPSPSEELKPHLM
ncbi:BMC domain-containing protein [Desulforhopalus sp. IMCC35007]|jgi:microcompartment protein CcmL/EutN|uniref:BMC domain-containing protein n=1 Tax=Desulforhopalus sp. IMCC35007 TaxID=2569543 RepID=UPI0010AE94C0|nr:BMC domain-containing protein [Desulforhopalus sp. IMCC35007]TKB09567.1 BMC domain-containing protein [Desulforhopalus sp. IMCC35007]